MGRSKLESSESAGPAGRNPLVPAAVASVWVATFGNWPLWRAFADLPEMASLRGAVFVAAFGFIVALLLLICLALVSFARSVKPAIALVLVSAALGAHFMGTYGIVIDTTMMANVLQTDVREARDLVGARLLASLALMAGLPMLWVWRVRVRRLAFASQLWRNGLTIGLSIVAIAALVFASFADLSATMRNHKSLRFLINPLNSYYALAMLAHESNARQPGPPEPIGADAHVAPRSADARPPLLVLVVGETARADHFSLNGYARATNPELAREDVLSFREVSSCGTSTAASLPCMFSHLGRKGFEARERESENLLDVVQRSGMAVLWIDNQSGCKGVCERVPNVMAQDPAPGGPPLAAELCSEGECFDSALLQGLDQRLASLPAEQRAQGVLLVLHQMGSHGPAYYKRSPPQRKPFLPECTTHVLQQCAGPSLINAYDNSIAYTDHALAGVIGWLKSTSRAYDAGMLYVSDHGESLGENNLYLHGLPYALAPREQTHVPMIVWLSSPLEHAQGLDSRCLRESLDAPLSHDHLFHTVLGALAIRTSEYRNELDAFAACRRR